MLRHWIIGLMTPHRVYVEPFGGGASVLLSKPRSLGEVYNDLDSDVVRLFRVLREPGLAAQLREQLALTPFSREEYQLARGSSLDQVADDVEAARRLVARSFMSHGTNGTSEGAAGATGFRARSWSSHRSAPMDFMNLPAALEAVTERLRGVVIENRPAIEVLLQHDGPDTLHYVDPPYLEEVREMRVARGYRCEMTREDHERLAEVLRDLQGHVMVSGYASALYAGLYEGWQTVERETYADGASPRTEVIWSNRAVSAQGRLW